MKFLLGMEDVKSMLHARDDDGNFPLLVACTKKDENIIKEFLRESEALANYHNKFVNFNPFIPRIWICFMVCIS